MDRDVNISHGLHGEFHVPGDKSISHRALIIASMAHGTSEIEGCSTAADPKSTRHCLEDLGVRIDEKGTTYKVYAQGLHGFHQPLQSLDAGNSGTTIRLLSGVLSGQKFSSVLKGDLSLSRRPMKRVFDPLRLMGANIHGTDSHTPPITITAVNTLSAIDYDMPVSSAQVKSAIILAGLMAEGTTIVRETIQTRDHTERMLGLETHRVDGKWSVSVDGGRRIDGQKFFVPGDISAAAFLIVGGLLVPKSDFLIKNVGLNPTRTELIRVLQGIGGCVEILDERTEAGERIGDIHVKSSSLNGSILLEGETVAKTIDEIPVLAIAGLFTEGTFCLRNADELRKKESDRISAMSTNLRKLGVDVEEYADGFSFTGTSDLKGSTIESFDDHRIAMAFGIAGMLIPGMSIRNAECVDISFPGFWGLIS